MENMCFNCFKPEKSRCIHEKYGDLDLSMIDGEFTVKHGET